MLTDVPYNVNDLSLPQKGDYVLLEKFLPKEEKGNTQSYLVVARHFFYSSILLKKPQQQQDYMIVIVTDAPNLPEVNFRE